MHLQNLHCVNTHYFLIVRPDCEVQVLLSGLLTFQIVTKLIEILV